MERLTSYLWWIGFIHGFVVGDDPWKVPLRHRGLGLWLWFDDDGEISRSATRLGPGEDPQFFALPAGKSR